MTSLTPLSSELSPKPSEPQVDEALRSMADEARLSPLLFINHFLYTFDPRVTPPNMPFHTFPFQNDYIMWLQHCIDSGIDEFTEKCRDMGATYMILATFLWYWRYHDGSNFHLGSRKEDLVDNRSNNASGTNKEESLFGKLDYMISRMPSFMLPEGFSAKQHFTYMSLINPENGNAITGESSNPDFSRAGRYKAELLDEFAFWENGIQAWGATADSTRCRIVLTTPAERPGTKAYRLRFGRDGEKIHVTSLYYNLDPRKDEKWLAGERARRSAEDFGREVMINWEVSITGRVYPEIDKAVAGAYPLIPLSPIYTSWDFGLDGVAIGWWQINPANGKPRLLDAFYNHDKPIQWYFPLFGKPRDSAFTYNDEDDEAINVVKNYAGGTHFGDPDVEKRSILTGTTTRAALQEVGIYVQTRPEANEFVIRREKTKVTLQNGIEINLNKRTQFFLDCVKESRYPDRPETSQATGEIVKPIHNWTSHHRTQLEYFIVNLETVKMPEVETPDWAEHVQHQRSRRGW